MRFYLSHSIRGTLREKATAEQELANCQKAMEIASELINKFPKLELYVPGAHEFPLIRTLRDQGSVTVKQLLNADCAIIDNCDGIIVYVPEGDELQGGRLVEYNHAVATNKPVFVFAEIDSVTGWLTQQFLSA